MGDQISRFANSSRFLQREIDIGLECLKLKWVSPVNGMTGWWPAGLKMEGRCRCLSRVNGPWKRRIFPYMMDPQRSEICTIWCLTWSVRLLLVKYGYFPEEIEICSVSLEPNKFCWELLNLFANGNKIDCYMYVIYGDAGTYFTLFSVFIKIRSPIRIHLLLCEFIPSICISSLQISLLWPRINFVVVQEKTGDPDPGCWQLPLPLVPFLILNVSVCVCVDGNGMKQLGGSEITYWTWHSPSPLSPPTFLAKQDSYMAWLGQNPFPSEINREMREFLIIWN